MKISIITVVYNNAAMIGQCIDSVLAQDCDDIEYIVIDGASTDGTVDVVKGYGNKISKLISEKDRGLYDAMNKGIKAATGDVVGILNSDDFFYDNQIISKIAQAFKNEPLDATIADIVFVKRNTQDKVIRTYSAKKWTPSKFAWGYMPPHPSIFIKRSVLNKIGPYKTEYQIGADFELLIRCFTQEGFRWKYLPMITTKMYMGGKSTSGFKSLFVINKEQRKACRENNIPTNYLKIYSKYLFKPFEFLRR
jgi:glycosyltransferase involved in cell wall biosynthesis